MVLHSVRNSDEQRPDSGTDWWCMRYAANPNDVIGEAIRR